MTSTIDFGAYVEALCLNLGRSRPPVSMLSGSHANARKSISISTW